eukprot:TRINITY_DN156_c0_g2_i3.p1 TRINITY_DN156_c0_g2~~TRINITY_DN156_c0_g2_i3.p1  ORF type:complete len:466 (+),score=117.91 TRINITY_DN156_c0_g2_i3:51-1400(+)
MWCSYLFRFSACDFLFLRVNGDGCDSSCNVEAGWTCGGSGCKPVCGDGVIRGTETCDDGNSDPGDGCSATCQTEFGYTCVGQPSFCATTCGDGLKAGLEACDDGNTRPDDGCTNCNIDPGWYCVGNNPSVCQFGSPPTTGVVSSTTARPPTTTSSAVPATSAASSPAATTSTPSSSSASTSTSSSSTSSSSTASSTSASASTSSTSSSATSTSSSSTSSTSSTSSSSTSSSPSSGGSSPPPPPPPPPPPTNWPDPSCGASEDYRIMRSGVPAFTVSAATGSCDCVGGYSTVANVTASSVTALGTVTASGLMYPVFYSTQPSSRFESTGTAGWEYTGESLTVTLSTATRLRFVLRQMVFNAKQSIGNFAFAVSVSSSSASYSNACDAPAPQNFSPAQLFSTTSAEWYCTVPAGTTSYYVYINVISGGGTWAVANEASANRSMSSFHAAAN